MLGDQLLLECGPDATVPSVRKLLGAYELRQRAYRRAGAAIALVLAVAAQLLGGSSTVTFRLGAGGSIWANLILLTLGGSFAGSIVAELYNVRRRWDGPRLAELRVRDYDDYAVAAVRLGLWCSAGLVAAGAAAVVIIEGAAGFGTALAFCAAALTVAVGPELVGRSVVRRPRPLMAAPLRRADDVIRRSAVNRSLLARAVALELLMAAWVALVLSEHRSSGPISWLIGAAPLACLIGAVVVVRRSSSWTLTLSNDAETPGRLA